jgi:hypothetical protein
MLAAKQPVRAHVPGKKQLQETASAIVRLSAERLKS